MKVSLANDLTLVIQWSLDYQRPGTSQLHKNEESICNGMVVSFSDLVSLMILLVTKWKHQPFRL